jgi:hypothetical protein
MLLAAGSDVHHKGNGVVTALSVAIHFKQHAVEALLCAHIIAQEASLGPDVDTPPEEPDGIRPDPSGRESSDA